MDDTLNSQIPSNNNVVLGYDHKETNKDPNYEILKSDNNPKTYATSLQMTFKREKNHINIKSNHNTSSLHPKINDYRRNTNPRRTPQKRCQQLFLRYCFSCHNFGNKALNYKAYRKNYQKSVQGYHHRNKKSSSNQRRRNYNSFSPLVYYNIGCYKCNNYGHKDSDCRLLKASMKIGTSNIKHKNIWKEKQIEEKKTKCKVALDSKKKKI